MKKRKVIITKLPQAKSGVEVKLDGLRAGLGYNANVLPWPVMAGKMSEPKTEARKTLGPVPRDLANLEAEKDEIAMIPDEGGIPSTFLIGGKRHHSGGTPLYLPSDSFIFSDTAKMRIKDENILKQFGMPFKKKGYTPAEIAKKYDINEFKKVLADPNTDKLQRETAELMIANYNLKLAKLAIFQESMKGFPQGMPQVGMPYIEEMEIDPAQFVQMNPGQGQDDTAEADNMSRFGGPLHKAYMGYNMDYSDNLDQNKMYRLMQAQNMMKERENQEKANLQMAGRAGFDLLGSLGDRYTQYSLKKAGKPYEKEITTASEPVKPVGSTLGIDPNATQKKTNLPKSLQPPKMTFSPGGFLPMAKVGQITDVSPNAGAVEQYKDVDPQGSTTEGQKTNTNKVMVQPWKLVEKNKANISGVAKAEGILGTAALATNFFNQRNKGNLEDYLGTSADQMFSTTPAGGAGYRGTIGQTGMAYGMQSPIETGNLVQQPGNLGISMYGGDVDYFANGGYLPMAQDGEANVNKLTLKEKEELARKLAVNDLGRMLYSPFEAYNRGVSAGVENVASGVGKVVKGLVLPAYNIATKGPGLLLEKLERRAMAPYLEALGVPTGPKRYASQKEYEADLLTPYSPEKKEAQVAWLMSNPTPSGKGVQTAGQSAGDSSSYTPYFAPGSVTEESQAEAESKPTQTAGSEQPKKPAVKKQQESGVPEFDWSTLNTKKEGGSINGKRRVLIHSLGKYATGGILPKAQNGASTPASKKVKGQTKDPNGKWHLVYDDNTISDKAYDHKFNLVPYKGKDHPTQYNAVDWLNFAVDAGFEPTTDDPTEQAKELQRKLWDDPNWGEEVKKLHLPKEQGGFGLPKAGNYDDGYLGERWEQLLKKAPKKQPGPTPPVKDDTKKTTDKYQGVYAESLKGPQYPAVGPKFTTQDMIRMGPAFARAVGVRGIYPTPVSANVYTADTRFESPESQYQQIGSLFNTAAQNLAAFGDPRTFNARLSELAGKSLNAIAQTAAQVEARNIDRANQRDAVNAQIMNTFAQSEADRKKRFFDETAAVNTGIRDEKRATQEQLSRYTVDALNNMANIYNINQLYPQYAVDRTGMLYFKNPRELKGNYGQQKTVDQYFNEILSSNENLRNEKGMAIAYDMAKNLAGQKTQDDGSQAWLKAYKGVVPSYNVGPYGYGEQEG